MNSTLDQAADDVARILREFRRKHWAYFYSTERVDPKTRVVLPRVRNDALDREASRLFEIVRNANKAALDAEHEHSTNLGVAHPRIQQPLGGTRKTIRPYVPRHSRVVSHRTSKGGAKE